MHISIFNLFPTRIHASLYVCMRVQMCMCFGALIYEPVEPVDIMPELDLVLYSGIMILLFIAVS